MPPNGQRAAIQKGLDFLRAVQRSDGGFDSFSSPSRVQFAPKITYQTVFAPALILSGVSKIDDAHDVSQKISDYLLAQKSQGWSFNYWDRNSKEHKLLPYPDDLDDTFCALIALYQYSPSLIDAECLARVVKLLLATEQRVGGPYRTWLIGRAAADWQDVDIAVNANIQCFLNLVARPLGSINELAKRGSLKSKYYPTSYPIFYYLARANLDHANLAQKISARQVDGRWPTPLKTALSVCAMVRLGKKFDPRAIDFLLSSQLPDGSWPAEAFCIDPQINGQVHFNGAAALSTAFVLEALSLAGTAANYQPVITVPDKADEIFDQVFAKSIKSAIKLERSLKTQFLAYLEKTKKSQSAREIALLPYLFSESLAKPTKLAAEFLARLGIANLNGWMAYTIYDDFLDSEGQPDKLPVANVTLRQSLEAFYLALPSNLSFQRLVAQTFDVMDGANAWETACCRFNVRRNLIEVGKIPNYGRLTKLAERSLGHSLTPLAILAYFDLKMDSREVLLIRRAFAHYLIARQLNDDMHDWRQDFAEGRISFVVARILQEMRVVPGLYDINLLADKMQNHFWTKSLEKLCTVVSSHLRQSRQAITDSGLIAPQGPFVELIGNLEATVARTLSEKHAAEDFYNNLTDGNCS